MTSEPTCMVLRCANPMTQVFATGDGARRVEYAVSGEHDAHLRAGGYRMAGPALVEAEVDLRTGAITDFVASRGAGSPSAGSVSAAAAEEIARETVPGAVLVDVQRETWSGPVWRVILERPEERLTPNLVQVIVDARTGDVVRRLTT